jgi:hypothetical protein
MSAPKPWNLDELAWRLEVLPQDVVQLLGLPVPAPPEMRFGPNDLERMRDEGALGHWWSRGAEIEEDPEVAARQVARVLKDRADAGEGSVRADDTLRGLSAPHRDRVRAALNTLIGGNVVRSVPTVGGLRLRVDTASLVRLDRIALGREPVPRFAPPGNGAGPALLRDPIAGREPPGESDDIPSAELRAVDLVAVEEPAASAAPPPLGMPVVPEASPQPRGGRTALYVSVAVAVVFLAAWTWFVVRR